MTAHDLESSLRQSLGQHFGQRICLKERLDSDFNVVEVSVSVRIDSESDRGVIAAIEYFLKPASPPEISGQIAKLRLLSAVRASGQEDLDYATACMAEELLSYPAWAVKGAVSEWLSKNKFFPSLCELKALCESRIRLLEAVSEALSRATPLLEKSRTKIEEHEDTLRYNQPHREALIAFLKQNMPADRQSALETRSTYQLEMVAGTYGWQRNSYSGRQ